MLLPVDTRRTNLPVSDGATKIGTVACGSSARALADRVRAAGWAIGEELAEIRLVDARANIALIAAEEARAVADRAALLALIPDATDASAAYARGATHILVGDPDAMALGDALAFAGRYARRLRGAGRTRRAGEISDGAAARFLATLGRAESASVAVIAITRFDTVNVAFGRDVGDALLREAAARIAALLPTRGVIERDEGARFIVAFSMDAEDHASPARIASIEAALNRRFVVDGLEASLGVRIGVAHRAGSEDGAALIRRAREALDRAIGSDGAAVRIAPHPQTASDVRLAADLHRAIDRDEIDILFQPQVSLREGHVLGVEALARWEHPVHGVLGAATLFAAADRAGLATALSEHIQALALRRAATWRGAMGALRVAVNVTAADLARGDFPSYFLDLVTRSGIAPSRVTAEVTESGLVDDLPIAAARLDALRGAGLRVAIDDFGTGYSSLAYLKALPLDYLKIDRSLTQDIAGAPRGRIVVRGIIAIAAGLGLRTIAEGVESEEERRLLADEGCDLYQGFLCAGPLDERELARLIEMKDG
ncbi:bifunctional diguanylate cyclase/phosphodiesterase [Sphingomonas sp. TZW2008]|uniref:putative bifunctional diguanylate cyclase/phosphodiesterase n=1 Tax=Sphingomonas sp. TZW2008 TaxID=1917973 RepID=UPI000A271ACF|nr:GGDEF domain-containing phosphodiesterase [Sphingomonas sp. TZW2008]